MITKFDGHTPGPWEYDELNFVFAGEENKMVAEVRGAGSGEPMDINGKLIAAAPDLLARIKAMYEVVNKYQFKGTNEWGEIDDSCLACGLMNAHSSDCPLAAELRATEQLLGIEVKKDA